ncbi:MAG: hypothetical protein Q7T18_04080 [Sedimentisphaerales bacterium]|nr:hypothetical protein [Sedimentisphaerales bacterium]
MRTYFFVMTFVSACAISGCGVPQDALRMSPTTLQDRQLQTRMFYTNDEANILSASAAALQDMGFSLDESETELGVIVASKDRSATDAGQVVGAIFIAAMTGVASPIDSKQKIRVSLVTYPSGEKNDKITVRVTFQRIVWDTQGQVTKLQRVDDPKLYEGFFEKLSKSVFLEAQNI